GERALRGPMLISGDFFPTPAPFNPTPDIITGLYRHAFGYRLGTIVNLVALLWTAAIVERLMRDWIRSVWFRCAAILFVIATEQLLFQINNYMVDLLALPLLLEATVIALNLKRVHAMRSTIRLLLLLGAAVAFKLANLIYAVPISFVFLANLFTTASPNVRPTIRQLPQIALAATIAFVLPLVPFTIFIYRLTGNPVFPFYNGLFKSPYWPQGALFDPRWGPYGVIETIVWPVVMLFRPERLSEYHFYSGRLTLGFVLAISLILICYRHRRVWQLAFITFIGAILWSAGSGYIRYALYLELTSGLLMIWVILSVWKKLREQNSRAWFAVAWLPLFLLLPSPFALAHAYKWEWSARETIFQRDVRTDLDEASNLLRDRSLTAYIAPEDRKLVDDVGLWIETTYKTSAIEALLKPQTPILGVRVPEYFVNAAGRNKFAEAVAAQSDKRMFTLTTREGLDNARNELANRGLSSGTAHSVSIYYFARSLKFDLLLFEVSRRERQTSADSAAEKGIALPDDAFSARLSVANPPQTMRVGQKYELRVLLTNASALTWPGQQRTWQFQLTVGNRWSRKSGEKVNDVDGRVALFQDLRPGETVELPLTVTAPNQPGIYILQLDAIQESVAWFGDRGSPVLNLTVRVE
ncbi:MAG TPA: hypothetical protein VE863_11175, partial [Pyrinomonadaceae bacterium]|nr:hypothetical protein [Pyrinomonadaceae bacterium]